MENEILAEHSPGWDAKAISSIARKVFGGYSRMFEVHGWPERGQDMMPAVQRRVCETYTSVQKFADTFCGAFNQAERHPTHPGCVSGNPTK